MDDTQQNASGTTGASGYGYAGPADPSQQAPYPYAPSSPYDGTYAAPPVPPAQTYPPGVAAYPQAPSPYADPYMTSPYASPYVDPYAAAYAQGDPSVAAQMAGMDPMAPASPSFLSTPRGLVTVLFVAAFVISGALIAARLLSSSGQLPSLPDPVTAASATGPRGMEDDATWRKIVAEDVTNEDLDVLAVLEGSMQMAELDAPGLGAYASFYVSSAESERKWPGEDGGWGTPDTSSVCPQLWVRLARLSKEWASSQAEDRGVSGSWDVVDFSYPIGDEGEEGCVRTRIIGTSPETLGMVLDVEYYRWERKPRFHMDEEALDAAVENHGRVSAAIDSLVSFSKETGHEVLVQGTDVPTVFIDLHYTPEFRDAHPELELDEYDCDYDMCVDDAMDRVTRQVGEILGSAGYESGRVSAALWGTYDSLYDGDTVTFDHEEADRFRWEYEVDDDALTMYSIHVTPSQLRHRMASGAFIGSERPTATARWEKGSDPVIGPNQLGQIMSIGVPDADPTEAYEVTGLEILGLPEQIGGSVTGPMYGYYTRPYDPSASSSLCVLYGSEDADFDGLLNYGCIAEIRKARGGRPYAAKDFGKREQRELPDGTIITVCSHTDEELAEYSFRSENDRAITWMRDVDGESYAYMLELEDTVLSDEEIADIVTSVV